MGWWGYKPTYNTGVFVFTDQTSNYRLKQQKNLMLRIQNETDRTSLAKYYLACCQTPVANHSIKKWNIRWLDRPSNFPHLLLGLPKKWTVFGKPMGSRCIAFNILMWRSHLTNVAQTVLILSNFPFITDKLFRASLSLQRSLHSAPTFCLSLKLAVNGTHQCDLHILSVAAPTAIQNISWRPTSKISYSMDTLQRHVWIHSWPLWTIMIDVTISSSDNLT